MMLRSSSTPVLGSLLPSISPESPNNHHHDTTLHLHPYKSSPIHRFSFHQTSSPGSQHFTTLSCNSSPISPSIGNGGMRRAQSEGNLESLMNSGCGGGSDDDFSFFNQPKKSSNRLHSSLLETIPSFSYHNSRFKSDGDEPLDDEEQEEDDEGFCEFRGFNIENKVLSLNKQMGFGSCEIKDDIGETGSQMYLAKGIGVDAGFACGDGGAAGSGGGGRNLSHLGGEEKGGSGGDDNHVTEEHYRKMVNENPGNPLVLGNYAQFLYESKQDLQGAEEYYWRAICWGYSTKPVKHFGQMINNFVLSQYAKLSWELHHDKDRATGYFERAIQAASEDSHVHAAYASFLWEVKEDEDKEEEEGCYSNIPPLFNNGKMASAATA